MHAHFVRQLVTLAFVFAVGFQNANSGPLATATGSVSLSQRRPSARVETVQFQSALLGKTLPYNVVLPANYRVSTATRYPVLYLLHGWAGHYSDWVTRTNVADYAAQYRIILVMPEGNDGWYTDGVNASDKYESYILQELIPDVQRRYRTIESRYGRGIGGLSMGGYGALKFGLKSPGSFAFAGSLSGALAATTWTEDDLKSFKGINDSLTAAFGSRDSPKRKANDIFEIVRGMSGSRATALPYFYFDCGTEDFFLSVNQQFATLLAEKKVPHEFRELPGAHGWQYWDQQVKELLKIAAEKLKARKS